jgi:hypothetical protein
LTMKIIPIRRPSVKAYARLATIMPHRQVAVNWNNEIVHHSQV